VGEKTVSGRMAERSALPLTLVVIAQDAEAVIGRCLSSVADFVDQMIVVDSGSTDGTVSRAEALGARVIQQPWLGYGAQRQVGVVHSRNDWILCLDADEVVTPELAESIRRVFDKEPPVDAVFSLDRDIDFLGVSLRSPLRKSNTRQFVRLFNRTTSGWDTEAAVHERSSTPRDLDCSQAALSTGRTWTSPVSSR
jgi:glycosyltransferase involved in cell wall biosynthesis